MYGEGGSLYRSTWGNKGRALFCYKMGGDIWRCIFFLDGDVSRRTYYWDLMLEKDTPKTHACKACSFYLRNVYPQYAVYSLYNAYILDFPLLIPPCKFFPISASFSYQRDPTSHTLFPSFHRVSAPFTPWLLPLLSSSPPCVQSSLSNID